MLTSVLSKAHEDGTIKYYGLAVRSRMILRCFQVFNSKESPCRNKGVAGELSSIFIENVCWRAVRDEPIFQEYNRIENRFIPKN